MHLFLCADESESELRHELAVAFPASPAKSPHPLLFTTEFALGPETAWPRLVFCRQMLPEAQLLSHESIRAWAEALFAVIAANLPDNQPWAMHLEPHYGARVVHHIGARAWHSATRRGTVPVAAPLRPATEVLRVGAEAGRQRCRLIREAVLELLRKKRRHLLRQLRAESPVAFTGSDSLVQLLLTSPLHGFLSLAPASLPFRQRHLLSPFPKGEVPAAEDKAAPSRAFAKLAEAELRLGRVIRPGETCVDLGASPGSWTWFAATRGARVIAIDRSPLRDDLLHHPQIDFQAGDAFRFKPTQPVDWLLCDVIAAPERTAELLLTWARQGWCRHFIVTLKLGDGPATASLATLDRELAPLTAECFLTRLCANKKEVCAFGTLRA